jgi:hypothetical protein
MSQYHDIIGSIGVALILLCYFLIQIGKISAENIWYSVLNLIGASMILFSLYYEFNFASVLIEGFWVLISIIGIVRFMMRRLKQL